jgi:hypothetical protein
MWKFERFLDYILGLSKIVAYWRSRCVCQSFGERAQILHEMEHAFTIMCREITRGGQVLIWQTASGITGVRMYNWGTTKGAAMSR